MYQHQHYYYESHSNSDDTSLALVLRATTEADLSIVLLVLLGSFFAFKGVFDSRGVSDMGKLVYHVSLPCLLFSKILYEFSIERLKLLWVLVLACVLHVVSGYVLGEVLGRLACVSRGDRKVGTASMMFGNVGALAIAVVDSLCHSKSLVDLTGSQQECSSIGISYIAFYLITQNILMFSWGESLMLAADMESEEVEGGGQQGGEQEEIVVTDFTEREERDLLNESFLDGRRDVLCKVSPMPLDLEWPQGYSIKLGHKGLEKVQSHLALEADHCTDSNPNTPKTRTRMSDTVDRYTRYMQWSREQANSDNPGISPLLEDEEEEEEGEERKGIHWQRAASSCVRSVKASFALCVEGSLEVVLRLLKTPALQAALAAIALASFPKLKGLFIMSSEDESQPPLYFVYDAVSTMGNVSGLCLLQSSFDYYCAFSC